MGVAVLLLLVVTFWAEAPLVLQPVEGEQQRVVVARFPCSNFQTRLRPRADLEIRGSFGASEGEHLEEWVPLPRVARLLFDGSRPRATSGHFLPLVSLGVSFGW